MSKKTKNPFEAADVRRAVEAETKLAAAHAEIERLRAAAAAPPPAPPPPPPPPPPPAPPPETPLQVFRRLKGEPQGRMLAAAYWSDHADEIAREVRGELEAQRAPARNPYAAEEVAKPNA